MKYLSEKTNKAYSSVEELQTAEKEFEAKNEAENKAKLARADDAKKVEEAHTKLAEATKNYDEVLTAFLKKYGSYHMTYTIKNNADDALSMADRLFNDLWF